MTPDSDGGVYVVITIDPVSRAIADCEIVSGCPKWDWLSLHQIVRLGDVNGGDSVEVVMPEENRGR